MALLLGELNALHGSASRGFVRPPARSCVRPPVRNSTILAILPQPRPTEHDTKHRHARTRPLATATSPHRTQHKHTHKHTSRPSAKNQINLAPPHSPVPERCMHMQSHQAFPRINLGKRYPQVVPSQARRRRTRGIAGLQSDAALPQPTGAKPGPWATHPRCFCHAVIAGCQQASAFQRRCYHARRCPKINGRTLTGWFYRTVTVRSQRTGGR